MFYKVEYQKRAHQEVEKIFRVLLPEQGLAVREEQIRLCHEMLDTLLDKNGIYSVTMAFCNAMLEVDTTTGRCSNGFPLPVNIEYFRNSTQATR